MSTLIRSFSSQEAYNAAFTDQQPALQSMLDRLIYFFTKSPFYAKYREFFVKATDQFPYARIWDEVSRADSRYCTRPKNVIPAIYPRDELMYRQIYTLNLYEIDAQNQLLSLPCACYLIDSQNVTIYEMPSVFAAQDMLFQNAMSSFGAALADYTRELEAAEAADEW